MSSPEEKQKHRERMQRKKKERVRSNIAKDLLTAKYKQRIVEDKHGVKHDLDKLSHAQLIKLIQDEI